MLEVVKIASEKFPQTPRSLNDIINFIVADELIDETKIKVVNSQVLMLRQRHFDVANHSLKSITPTVVLSLTMKVLILHDTLL